MENIHNFGKNVKSLPLYTSLFAKTVKNSDQFIDQITDPDHKFYGAARDVAREILNRTEGGKWAWLSARLDDIGAEVEKDVSKKIQIWKWKSILGNGKMPLYCPAATIKWLFERMVSEYKNLFDKKRKNYLDLGRMDKLVRLEALNKLQENEVFDWEMAA